MLRPRASNAESSARVPCAWETCTSGSRRRMLLLSPCGCEVNMFRVGWTLFCYSTIELLFTVDEVDRTRTRKANIVSRARATTRRLGISAIAVAARYRKHIVACLLLRYGVTLSRMESSSASLEPSSSPAVNHVLVSGFMRPAGFASEEVAATKVFRRMANVTVTYCERTAEACTISKRQVMTEELGRGTCCYSSSR